MIAPPVDSIFNKQNDNYESAYESAYESDPDDDGLTQKHLGKIARDKKVIAKKIGRKERSSPTTRTLSPAISIVSSELSPSKIMLMDTSTGEELYSMAKYGDFHKKKSRLMKNEMGKLIEGITDWRKEDGRDFEYAVAQLSGAVSLALADNTQVFIKKIQDKSAWEREYENLFNLRKCKHVPVFYCSLLIEKTSKFFIITEKCDVFKEKDKLLLKYLPDHLDNFHSFDYFHGDLGNPENIMVATREGQRKLVFIDLDDTYSLEEEHTKDTSPNEEGRLLRDDKISAFRFVESDGPDYTVKKNIFMACDRFSLMHSLLTLLGHAQLLPGNGETHLEFGGGGYNCLYDTTNIFYNSFIPNIKIVGTASECRTAGREGDGNIFWNFRDTIILVDLFNRCYAIFKANLEAREVQGIGTGSELFNGIDIILQGQKQEEPPIIASMKSSFVRIKSKKRKTNRKNKKLKKSRRKTNRKNKKLKSRRNKTKNQGGKQILKISRKN